MAVPIELVFVVCSGRSGSTLLQSMFDAHPNICAPIESKFVLHLAGKYHYVRDWNEKTISSFCTDLYTNRKFRLFWNVPKRRLLESFSNYPVDSFEDACKVVYMSYPSIFNKGEIKMIVDKNPLHIRFMEKLSEIFPEAKFIHLVRDPRAVYNSRRKAFNAKPVFLHVNRWDFENTVALDFGKEHPEKYFLAFYERLIMEPEKSLKEMLDFLRVPFHGAMLSGHQLIAKRIGENNYLNLAHHRNISKPLMIGNIGKWRTEVSPKNIRRIEAVNFNLATFMGYSMENPILSTSEKLRNKTWKTRLHLRHQLFEILFELPFCFRKKIYNLVSLFFDGKYKKRGGRSDG